MRVLVTSDWHLDAVTAGVPRREEVLAFAAKILRVALDAKPDLFLHLGDWYTPGSMRDALYASDVARFISAMSRVIDRGAAIYLAGNHDELDLSDGEHPNLDPAGADPDARHPVSTLTAPAVFAGRVASLRAVVCERPQLVRLGRGWVVLALPHCAPVMGVDYAAEVARMAAELSDAPKVVVAAHLTIPGAMLGSESRELARGRDDLLPIDEIAKLRPRLIVNGHYHRPQVVPSAAGDIAIPGSPVRMTFAERDDPKGYLLIDLPERP